MDKEKLKEMSLKYHSEPSFGKIEVIPSKRCNTQSELSLAYTPGVAVPCKEIEASEECAYKYTSKGNLVGVISNGTAVLGLGDIGATASKPVMEGKGVLFKRFADVDVFDIEINEKDPHKLVELIAKLEPTFGGINLEDIKGPDCFIVEEELKKMMNIPVFHDDQHGTAIISGAGLLNALDISGKKIEDIKVVFNGSGAAGIACARFYKLLGVKPENLIMCDTKGVIFNGRKDGMNPYKEEFAVDTDRRTLSDALKGADVFVGLSSADIMTEEMILSMGDNPIIFALANPDPEIRYEKAVAIRKDIIMATGRSDYPNQINNVLGFPFIFRGALDVRASEINDQMKVAAAMALSELAKKEVPAYVTEAYNLKELSYGREYIIPKPFDKRVFIDVSLAVAKSAVETGVSRAADFNEDDYRKTLESRYELRLTKYSN